MSIVGGPPPIHIRMQAFWFLRTSAAWRRGATRNCSRRTASPRRRPGGAGSGGGTCRQGMFESHGGNPVGVSSAGSNGSRRFEPRRLIDFCSVVQDEFVGVQQGPEQVLVALSGLRWPGSCFCAAASSLLGRRCGRERRQIQLADLVWSVPFVRSAPCADSCPSCRSIAFCTSSPFIIISACGIVPLNVVDSSFSSVPNVQHELLQPLLPLLLGLLPACRGPTCGRSVATISESYSCSAVIDLTYMWLNSGVSPAAGSSSSLLLPKRLVRL